MNRCPICGDRSCRSRLENDGTVVFECPRCGTFATSVRLAGALPDIIGKGGVDRSTLSHFIRQRVSAGDTAVPIDDGDLAHIRDHLSPPKPPEQHDNLIRWLGDNQPSPGQFVQSRKKPLAALLGCHVTSHGKAEPELDWLLDQMKPLGLFETQFSNDPGSATLRLTLKGWELYCRLVAGRVESRRFVPPMPIEDGDFGSLAAE